MECKGLLASARLLINEDAFDDLAEEIPHKLKDVLNYFEYNYIGRRWRCGRGRCSVPYSCVPIFRLTGLFISPKFLVLLDFSPRTTGYTPRCTLTGMMAAAAAAASSKLSAGMLHETTSTKPAGQCK